MAREKADRGETLSSKSSKFKKSDDDDSRHEMSHSHIGDLNNNEIPEPEVLLAILNKKSKI